MRRLLILILAFALPTVERASAQKNNEFPFSLLHDTRGLERAGVSEGQLTQISGLQEQVGRLLRELSIEVEKRQADLQNVLLQPRVDTSQTERAVQGLVEAQGKILQAQTAILVQIRMVLTTEQWTKLAKRDRSDANEASCTATLRTLNTSEITFASTYNLGFTDGLNRLGEPKSGQPNENAADLVDPILSGISNGTNRSFVKNGYRFSYKPGSGDFGRIATYSITCEPLEPGVSGIRSFYTDQSAVVHWTDANRPANELDPVL